MGQHSFINCFVGQYVFILRAIAKKELQTVLYSCRELQHLRGGDRADPCAEPLHPLRLPPLRHVRLHELGNIQYSCLRPGRVKEGGIYYSNKNHMYCLGAASILYNQL